MPTASSMSGAVVRAGNQELSRPWNQAEYGVEDLPIESLAAKLAIE